MKQNIVTKKESSNNQKPSREEAKEAVRTMLAWAGENPNVCIDCKTDLE